MIITKQLRHYRTNRDTQATTCTADFKLSNQQTATGFVNSAASFATFKNFTFTCGDVTNGRAVAFAYTPVTTGRYDILLKNCATSGVSPVLQVVTGNCRSASTLFCSFLDVNLADATICAQPPGGLGVQLIAQTQYTILVSDFGNTDLSFLFGSDLTLQIQPNTKTTTGDPNFTDLEQQAFNLFLAPIIAATVVVFFLGAIPLLVCFCYCRGRPTELGEGKAALLNNAPPGACGCCCPRAPIARVRAICFAIMLCTWIINISTWAVVWSVFAYFLGLALSVVSIIVLLTLREPSSTSALANSSLVRNFGAMKAVTYVSVGLLFINGIVALAQSIILFAYGCPVNVLLCRELVTLGAYGIISVLATIALMGLSGGLVSNLTTIIEAAKHDGTVVGGMILSTNNNQVLQGDDAKV